MKSLLGLFASFILLPGLVSAADKRPMQVEDLFKFKRVAAPQISPDGRQVVYQVTTVSLEENKSTTALWIAATDGKTPPKALTDPKGKKDTSPRWSPDGKTILFESTRPGTTQLFTVSAAGGEPKQITSISTGASSPIWSPDGTRVAFVSAVYPEFSEKPFAESDKLNKEKEERLEKDPVKAKVFTKLFYRHWVEYVDDKRQHLFVQRVAYRPEESPESPDALKYPRDVTPGDRDAYPTSTTFSSGDDFTFTPDSRHLVFTAVPEKNESWSTNYDLCRVVIDNTSTKWETLTSTNNAADSGPKFSPDGKKLAWRVQKKSGYEADKWDIVVAECKPDGTLASEVKNLTNKQDVSVNEFAWKFNDAVAYIFDFHGGNLIHTIFLSGERVKGVATGPPARGGFVGYQGEHVSGLTVSSSGETWVALESSLSRPPYIAGSHFGKEGGRGFGRGMSPNEALRAEIQFGDVLVEEKEITVDGGAKMKMIFVQPPGFDPKKKWPVVYLVHGGPQGAWEDSWSFRWNAQLWAAQGYVVAMPNPRGSTGFGQKFVDEITGDWGGKCYRDLVAGLDYVEKLPYVDKDRIASAGGSFGGYMMNWFAVSDIAPRFKCLVTHCSVWNFESMWGTTDELWFDEWEHGGLPWEKPQKYAEFSPHKKAGNLAKHKVPMLIIHNDLDFRCPIGQGHELFSALQRQGVPSRFVNFPDEGHWVLKPKNSQRWHQEVFGWLKKYCPPGGK